ncbi:unnamed protein product [Camellia sinensis]
MALRMWASSTANALRLSFASKSHLSPAFSLSRCLSTVLEGLKYATSHEWVKVESPVATIILNIIFSFKYYFFNIKL